MEATEEYGTCKEEMGGKGVGSYQQSRQPGGGAMTLWESHEGCVPMNGWKDRLVAHGVEGLRGHEGPSRDCLPWHSKRTCGKTETSSQSHPIP